jgi:competence protein ComEC
MKMHVINVGQSEAILFEFSRHAILVDAGSEESADNRYETNLFDYLDDFFARRTDLNRTLHSVIVSHPHKDHTRNLVKVFNRFTVRNFVEGGGRVNASGMEDVRAARRMLAQENAAHHRIYARDVKRPSFMRVWREELRAGSDVDIRFLSAGRRCNDDNNASLVMRVEYKGKSFLLIGDAEVDDTKRRNVGCGGLIYRLLDPQAAFPDLLKVNVLKVGHHGSHNGVAEIFMEKVAPDVAVISAGLPETRSTGESAPYHAWFYGHPREEAVRKIEAKTNENRPAPVAVRTMPARFRTLNRRMVKKVFCTCWEGALVLSVNADGSVLDVAASGSN